MLCGARSEDDTLLIRFGLEFGTPTGYPSQQTRSFPVGRGVPGVLGAESAVGRRRDKQHCQAKRDAMQVGYNAAGCILFLWIFSWYHK